MKLVRQFKRALKWMFIAVLVYLAILLIGLIPVNNNFLPAKDGIKIYIVSNAVHADIVVPTSTAVIDWNARFQHASFGEDVSQKSYVAFGWGDQGFFLQTETWDDFETSVAANALFLPSSSCLHVAFTQPEYYASADSVTITSEQYADLVTFIERSFKTNQEGGCIQIDGYAYSTNDAFFEARGHYHLLNTCNSWVGRGLKAAGVRVPWLSPLPKTPMLYIASESVAK